MTESSLSPLRRVAAEDANDGGGEHGRLVDPGFDLGEVGVALLAWGEAKIVGDRRARDVEPELERVGFEAVVVGRPGVGREPVGGRLDAVEAEVGREVHEAEHVHLLGLEVELVAERVGREAELQMRRASPADRVDGPGRDRCTKGGQGGVSKESTAGGSGHGAAPGWGCARIIPVRRGSWEGCRDVRLRGMRPTARDGGVRP